MVGPGLFEPCGRETTGTCGARTTLSRREVVGAAHAPVVVSAGIRAKGRRPRLSSAARSPRSDPAITEGHRLPRLLRVR